jgi:aryl-alcohol dehydrogenase-like predicted oxidoreductase
VNLDLRTLQLFVAVVEEQTAAKAAKREHIAASGVSKRIADLEKEIKVEASANMCLHGGHSWQNDAVTAPDFLYGTAWKEDRTPALVELALRVGFRGIDTANQRRHYFEAGVGQGLTAAYRAGIVTRAELFLQTKYTYQPGQDHRLPYDPNADLATQVAQSMASSLEHLDTDHVDSYVLHGPASGHGWSGCSG